MGSRSRSLSRRRRRDSSRVRERGRSRDRRRSSGLSAGEIARLHGHEQKSSAGRRLGFDVDDALNDEEELHVAHGTGPPAPVESAVAACKSKDEALMELFQFCPVAVPEENRSPEEVLKDKVDKSKPHFSSLLNLRPAERDGKLVYEVITRCVGMELASAQALATTTEEEFKSMFFKEGGPCSHAGKPGHGRALALEMRNIAVAASTKVIAIQAKRLEEELHGPSTKRLQVSERPAQAPGPSAIESAALERIVDRLDDRRKRRRARKVVSSGSTSSSSSGSFDIQERLRNHHLTGYPVWALPEPSTLRKLYKQSKRHKGQYVASKPFENWVPSHVGSALPARERKAALQRRERDCTKDSSKAMESIQCFWLAHSVVDRGVPPQAVQAHLAVLARLQADNDLEYVIQYERYLHADILENINNGRIVNFEEALGTVRPDLVQG